MILIFSKSKLETTTEKVMDWLHAMGGEFYRLNGKNYIDNITLENGVLKSLEFDLDAVNVIWNRRWSDSSSLLQERSEDFDALGAENIMNLVSNLWREKGILTSYLYKKLRNREWTTRPSRVSVNKLHILFLAKEVGLQVPDYLVTNNLTDLKAFADKYESIITKPVSDVTSFTEINHDTGEIEMGRLLTAKVDVKALEAENIEQFHFSFFQEYIKKEYEIRTFFFYGELYSMAIFSQNDRQTAVDFRNYNNNRPNRNVPYKLPADLATKVIALMEKAELNIGSIDLIKKADGGFYFLEVNPVGQFGMVSNPCNYYLEEKLAKHLINEDQK